jgi:hypothetical protein
MGRFLALGRRLLGRDLGFTSGAYTTPKTSEDENSNEDSVFAANNDGVWVVLDGVSQSFDSRRWVDLLGARLLIDGDIDAIARWCAADFDAGTPDDLPWYLDERRAAGSQGTFVKVVARPAKRIVHLSCTALGDCMAMIVHTGPDATRTLSTWPFQQVDELPARPPVLCSEPPHARGGPPLEHEMKVPRGSRCYLVTDGIGRYVLGRIEAGTPIDDWWPFFHGPLSQKDFREWVEQLKLAGLLEDDDATVLEVRLG